MHLIDSARLIQLKNTGSDDTRPMHGRVLCRVEEMLLYFYFFHMKVLTAHLADDKQMLLLTVCQLLFCQFQYVVIVRTCQTFICRDDEKCLFPIRLCICPGTIGNILMLNRASMP